MSELYNAAVLPQNSEFFTRLARNAPLLLLIGSAGVLVGLLTLATAAGVAFFWDFPLAKAAGGVIFFMASLVLTPAIHILYYRAEVLAAVAAPDGDSITKVLRQQVRFWRFVGVAVILWIALVTIAAVMSA